MQAALEDEKSERAGTEKALRGIIEQLQTSQITQGQFGLPQLVSLRQQLATALSAKVGLQKTYQQKLLAMPLSSKS